MSQKKYDLNAITEEYYGIVDYMVEYLLNVGTDNYEIRAFDKAMRDRFDKFLELAGEAEL